MVHIFLFCDNPVATRVTFPVQCAIVGQPPRGSLSTMWEFQSYIINTIY